MKKHINHEFISKHGKLIVPSIYVNLVETDRCIHCNKYFFEFKLEYFEFKLEYLFLLEKQIIICNEKYPCISEEELIIKSIIE